MMLVSIVCVCVCDELHPSKAVALILIEGVSVCLCVKTECMGALHCYKWVPCQDGTACAWVVDGGE